MARGLLQHPGQKDRQNPLIRHTGSQRLPWRVTYYVDRKQHQRSFPTKRLAETFLVQVTEDRLRRKAGLPLAKPDITLAELAHLYLAAYTRPSKPWLEQMLTYSLIKFGTIRVRHLAAELIGKWLNDLTLSPKTKRHILTSLRQVLNAGVEWGYLDRTPLTRNAIKAPPLTPTWPILPFESWDEVLAVANALPDRYNPLVRFACSTGLRISEWLALTWEDISDTHIQIRRTYTPRLGLQQRTKTPAGTRTVACCASSRDALAALPRPLHQSQLVFPGPRGHHLDVNSWRDKTWRKAFERTKLEYRPPYQMRHTYATLALTEGADLGWISEQMGHTDISITRKHYARYLKRYDDRQIAILDQIGASSGTQ